jgi:Domain of unknown function (DUF4412)
MKMTYFCKQNQKVDVMGKIGIHLAVFVSSFLCVLSFNTSNAQIGREIQQRLQQRTIQAVDTMSNDHKRPGRVETPKKLDSSPSAPADTTKAINLQDLFGGGQKAKYEASYTMSHEFKVELRTQEKPNKKEEITNMNMFYGENCTMSVMEAEDKKDEIRAVMDFKNNTSIMLNDEEMTGMAFSLDGMSRFAQENAQSSKDSIPENEFTITKTGNTKMIAGYLCEEVIMESEDMTVNGWYTNDIAVNTYENMANSKFFAGVANGAPPTSEDMTGTMMESHMQEKTGNKGTFHYLVKEVIVGQTVLDITKYAFSF